MKADRQMYKEAREDLKDFLVAYTGCTIQSGWPCGTCTIELLKQLGVNNPNEAWQAILQVRATEDKLKETELLDSLYSKETKG